jgi:curved DNA-binding protein CbpA
MDGPGPERPSQRKARARFVLGIGVDAGPDEIRRAFRARVFATHPDQGGGSAAFAEVLDAFDTLRTDDRPRPIVLALPKPGPRIDMYDSPRRPLPARSFAEALRAATLREWSSRN